MQILLSNITDLILIEIIISVFIIIVIVIIIIALLLFILSVRCHFCNYSIKLSRRRKRVYFLE